MQTYMLLQNHFYQSSELLRDIITKLLEKLHISIIQTKSLALDDKFLPFIDPIAYFKPLVELLNHAYEANNKLLVCDSKSLLILKRFLNHLCSNTDFKAELSKNCGQIDILKLEESFVFAPEVLLDTIRIDTIKQGRWEGFRCAFICDRELEEHVISLQILPRIESLTGLKILPFFKESYAYLLQSNPDLAFKMGAKDYYEMVDSGVDFIISANLDNFELMDRHTKEIKQSSGRDSADVPLLFMPQVILALFEDVNAQLLGFHSHRIPPKML